MLLLRGANGPKRKIRHLVHVARPVEENNHAQSCVQICLYRRRITDHSAAMANHGVPFVLPDAHPVAVELFAVLLRGDGLLRQQLKTFFRD